MDREYWTSQLPMYSHASNCEICPFCSCGCVSDWMGTHIMRCTGCKEGFVESPVRNEVTGSEIE